MPGPDKLISNIADSLPLSYESLLITDLPSYDCSKLPSLDGSKESSYDGTSFYSQLSLLCDPRRCE